MAGESAGEAERIRHEFDIELRFVHTNGIRMQVAESGPLHGPYVLLMHGWPETWYSWRHQLKAMGSAGYRAVAPSMRGYGATDAPASRAAYDCATICADMVGLLDEAGRNHCMLVGHDWGAILTWQLGLLRPDRFVALAALSVPPMLGGPESPIATLAALHGASVNSKDDDEHDDDDDGGGGGGGGGGDGEGEGEDAQFNYILYHNHTAANPYGATAAADHGFAEREYDSNVEGMLRRMYLLGRQSSVAKLRKTSRVVRDGAAAAVLPGTNTRAGWLPRLPAVPSDLPPWLGAQDLAHYTRAFRASGFRGGVNYYRNIERNWQLTRVPVEQAGGPSGRCLAQPVLFLAGEHDMVLIGYGGTSGARHAVAGRCAWLDRCVFLPDCGHWCQQEEPDAVAAALLGFAHRHYERFAERPASKL